MSDANVRSVTSRRGALRNALAAFAGAAISPSLAKAITATPTATEGPYWVDEKLNRSDIRTDPTTGYVVTGFPLKLNIGVVKYAKNKVYPVSGATVDIWHCDAYGNYSDEPVGSGNSNTQGQKWLRGYQITDTDGLCRFTTIYPGWYGGRTTHIHARVRTFKGTTATTNFTTQFFFDDDFTDALYAKQRPYRYRTAERDTDNDSDNIYNVVTSSLGSTKASPDGDKMLLRYDADNTHVVGAFQIVLV
ncbi:MAG: hypothetical protein QM754_20625 [Tepidisphaeraceae bacterium]